MLYFQFVKAEEKLGCFVQNSVVVPMHSADSWSTKIPLFSCTKCAVCAGTNMYIDHRYTHIL